MGWGAVEGSKFIIRRAVEPRAGAAAAVAIGLLSLLGACSRRIDAPPQAQGRYAGVGVFAAGRAWPVLTAGAGARGDVAGLADDETIVAVTDTRTGEIRECGALSGVCVGFNPWLRPAGAGAPAPLNRALLAGRPAADR